ncbi:MAG: glycoside hydrolase family 99-like domain-containing protein [Lentisphaeria bacterium]|nr:glycoside hydrolase family 99-like domain-containing protein [Lentisphaeria bacterium]
MDIAAYYFPNYHADAKNEEVHGRNWTEWELMKCARSRFEGHQQPKVPVWGYEDEADPAVMAKKIDTAKAYGIDAFIFDWYWYDGPYLQRALDEGFLPAVQSKDFKFALMWANHDWYDRHPCSRDVFHPKMLYRWNNTKENVAGIWDMIVEKYFRHPNYWRLDGKIYFSIYATNRFITQMGGVEACAEVLDMLRKKVKDAGLGELHINSVWYDNLDNAPSSPCTTAEWTTKAGFDSYTSYNCIFPHPLWEKDLKVAYKDSNKAYLELAHKAFTTLPAPYLPVVTAGWDTSPRTIQSDVWEVLGYPYLPVMEPDAEGFGELLRDLSKYDPKTIFINAWNEWTEGSYLEPDGVTGFALLDEVKKFKEAVAK